MIIDFTNILVAYDIISMGELHEYSAYLHLKNGRIYYSHNGEPDEEIIEDFNDYYDFIEDPFVVEIPHPEEMKLSQKSSQSEISAKLKNWCEEQNIKTKV
jgi:hypothetical protein